MYTAPTEEDLINKEEELVSSQVGHDNVGQQESRSC